MERYMLLVVFSLLSGSLSAETINDRKVLTADFRHRPPQMIIKDGLFLGPLKDVLDEAAALSGYKIQWEAFPFKRSLLRASKGETDLIPRVSYTSKRAQYLEYLEPIGFRFKTTLFVVEKGMEGSIVEYDDLYRLPLIGTKLATSYFSRFDEDTRLHKYPMHDDDSLAKMFIYKRLPAVAIVDKENFLEAMNKYEFTEFEFSEFQRNLRLGIFYAFSKNSANFQAVKPLNKALKSLTENGRVEQIYKSYHITNPSVFISVNARFRR